MSKISKSVKTLANSTAPAKGQGIPTLVTQQKIDDKSISVAIAKLAEQRNNAGYRQHDPKLFSTIVG